MRSRASSEDDASHDEIDNPEITIHRSIKGSMGFRSARCAY